MESILICPVCDTILRRIEKRYECINRHSYDVAREGYVNLLLANQKASKLPGDSREMLQARRRFLEGSHYHILSDTLNQLIEQQIQQAQSVSPKPITILEAGCGEGYYLGELQQFLTSTQSALSVDYWGLDIAKDAVRMAAQRYQRINFLVASTRRKIPIVDHCIDLLLTIFAPRNPAEYQRMMATNGAVIIVIPGTNHLRQLRTMLMMSEREASKQDEVIADFQDGFRLEQIEMCTDTIKLDNETLLDLVRMTPNYWHITPDIWQQMQVMERFETQIEFLILIFRRSHIEI
jgi:23S rRNA (guanine745-N1)-methyltransferase